MVKQRENELKQVLKRFGDEIVYIGAENGSGWMYIGPASNYKLIQKVFDDHKVKLLKSYTKVQNYICRIPYEIPKASNEKELFTLGLEYSKRLRQWLNYYEKLEEYFKTYKDPLDRIVTCVDHLPIANAPALHIQGIENGNFWFKEEFDAVYNKKEDK